MSFLSELVNKVNGRFFDYTIFDVPVEKQQAFISSLPEPSDDIERSYLQFCCQAFYNGRVKIAIFNIFSLPLYCFLSLIIWLRPALRRGTAQGKKALMVQEYLGLSIVPEELKAEYDEIVQIEKFQLFFQLSDQGRAVMREVRKRYFFSFYFSLKILLKILYYDNLISQYAPSAIISTSESSFASSVLTEYCSRCSLKHLNVMHGEKFYNIVDSFFHFTRSYVWSDFHRKLLISLRAEASQFCVARPQSLLFTENSDVVPCYDLKYYLTNESREELRIIAGTMKKLQELCRLKVAVRAHPKYTDRESLDTFFNGLEIEANSLPIDVSLRQTRAAVSLISTVLTQAFYNGIKVVFDDVSNPEKFHQFQKLQSVLFSEEYSLLSELLPPDTVSGKQ